MKALTQQQWANTAKVVLIIGWLFLMNSLISCSSYCSRKPCPSRLKRSTLVTNNTLSDTQFVVCNNQIIIFK